jgi:YegS/Rv2252/BmrU family lipid kinase
MVAPMSAIAMIVNPRSAGDKTQRQWPALRELVREQLGAFDEHFTRAPGDATALTRAALRGGAELVVAVGGDGTINEVVNGFFDGDTAVAPSAALGIMPAGTGGDFIKTLDIPNDARAALARIKRASVRPADVGRVSFVDHAGNPAQRYFINIASFGISGLVDRYVNQSSKALGGTLSFALATLRASVAYKNEPVRLTIDGGTAREGRIYTVAVANGRYFGGGMKIAPQAELDDGQLDIVTLSDMTKGDLLLHGLDLYSGTHLNHPKVAVHRGRRLEATPREGHEVLLDIDGEQPGRLPATFELDAGAIQIKA